MKYKIGIMGGTFNPIHNGHLTMAETARREYDLDEVIFMPAGLQWMKKDSPDWMDAELRYEMTALAIADRPHFRASRMEIDRPGNTYTYETLEILHKEEPQADLYYIIGTDTLANMPKWRNPEKVFSQCVILCALRDDADQDSFSRLLLSTKEAFPDSDIRPLSMKKMDISSSAIRKTVENGEALPEDMLPKAVLKYIQEHGLYRRSPGTQHELNDMNNISAMHINNSVDTKETILKMIRAADLTELEKDYADHTVFCDKAKEKLSETLEEKRFRHTLSVAQTSAALAMRYDVDPYRAYIAGLLHDCAKGLKNKKKLKLAEEYGISINEAERDNPDLLHAKLGAIIAKDEYGITDEEILSAIRYHTTGKPDMTTLEKIVYIADFIEIYRKPLTILEKARNEAFRDLDAGMYVILEGILNYLGKKGALIDPITRETYAYYDAKVHGTIDE